MSTGRLYKGSSEIEQAWVDDLIAELEAQVTFDSKHEIPYCGGSSQCWLAGHRQVFIDKDIPLTYKQKDGQSIDVRRYLIIHEAVERTLMQSQEQGGLGLPYDPAHGVATAIEIAAVEADGFSQDEYTAFWDKWEKDETADGQWTDVPPDLYMEPYIQSRDKKTMKNMHTSVLERLKARSQTLKRITQ